MDYTLYLENLIDEAVITNDLLNTAVEEIAKIQVYSEWILGLNVAIFALLIVLIFAVFMSNYK